MDHPHPPLSRPARILTVSGGVLAAAAVALSAYAGHAAQGDARAALYTSAVFAFGHGVALAALAPRATRRLDLLALGLLLAGALLFCGSIAVARLAGLSTGGLAPVGGVLMIVGWLVHAAAATRH